MVAACHRRLGDQPSLRFAVMDGRRPAGTDKYHLICANLAAQWFADLPAVLAQWTARLAPGGMLALTLLGAETFREWRAAHARCGLQPGTLPLYGTEELKAVFPADCRFHVATETWIDRPASGLDFLRGLRALGADTARAGHHVLPPAHMRQVLRELGPTPAITYELIYALASESGSLRSPASHSPG